MPRVLKLKSTPKEMRAVATGEKKVITREIRPTNARRHVLLNDSEECTGVIEYYALRLSSWELPGASILVSVKRTMLMEIEDENGNLVYYEQNGKNYQMVDIDYHLGGILDVTGEIPYV